MEQDHSQAEPSRLQSSVSPSSITRKVKQETRRTCPSLCSPLLLVGGALRLFMPDPRHSLNWLLRRSCSHICDPPHSLHRLFARPCSHFFDGIPMEMVCLVSTSACSWSFSQRLRVFRDVDQASRPMLLWTSKDSAETDADCLLCLSSRCVFSATLIRRLLAG